MTKYEEMRADVMATREREAAKGFLYCKVHTAWNIGGISFGMASFRQSYNGANAVQILHYVEGKKVNQKFFRDALASVVKSPR